MITSFYAAILAMFFIAMSIQTLKLRRELKIAVGDNQDVQMLRQMRSHANFNEYVPISIVLIYFFELLQAPVFLVHGLAIMLILGRALHAYGIQQTRENYRFRIAGMALTFTSLGTAALGVLFIHLG